KKKKKKRKTLKEITPEPHGIVLKPGPRRKRDLADGGIQITRRNVYQLVGSPVDSDGAGAPEAAYHDLFRIVCEINQEIGEGEGTAKMHHATNAGRLARPSRHQARNEPVAESADDWRCNRHRHQRPIAVTGLCAINGD